MIQKYIALQKVVECRSLAKAAEALGYSQSAMSQMISSLEDELSIKLLNRSKYGTELTVEGKELYPLIEETIYRYRASLEKAAEIRGLETGIIRMGTLASISANWLPPLIHEFEDLYPGITFVIHQGDYTSIQDWIRTGAIDFGFVSPDAVNGIELTILNQGEFKAILPENHPLSKEECISLPDLAKEPFILLEEGHYYEPLEAFRRAGVMPQIKYTIHDDYAIMAMVEEGSCQHSRRPDPSQNQLPDSGTAAGSSHLPHNRHRIYEKKESTSCGIEAFYRINEIKAVRWRYLTR